MLICPPSNEIDARGARFDAHVTAAAQEGFRLAVDDFDAHGSVTLMDSPSMIPTESEGGSSGRAAAAAISAAQRMAIHAARTAARRGMRRMEQAVTR